MTVKWCRLEDSDPATVGDKGVGLLELASAGLHIPQTVVLSGSADGNLSALEVGRILELLEVSRETDVLVRSSVLVDRTVASMVSGFFDSRRVDDGINATSAELRREYLVETSDGAAGRPLRNLAERVVFLVQRCIEPDFSGVAHLTPSPGSAPSVEVACVSGHLAQLLRGEVAGMVCDVAQVRWGTETTSMLMGTEDDLRAITKVPGLGEALATLRADMARLFDSVRAAREVEWLCRAGSLIYVQSQPLDAQGDGGVR